MWRAAVRDRRARTGFHLAFKSRFVTPSGSRGQAATIHDLPAGAATEHYRIADLAVADGGSVAAIWPQYGGGSGDKLYFAALR